MSEYQFATDDDLDLSAPPRTRGLVAALVVGIHLVVVLGLIQAFAPNFTAQVTEQVISTFTVTVITPPPSPKPPPPREPEKTGAAAPVGKKAVPKAAAAPRPKVAIANRAAPSVAGRGSDNAAGAAAAGQGTGAGGRGTGTGSGAGGNGQGGGAATKAVKIAGDINSRNDYPRESRDARIGNSVTIALTVGTDGRVKRCRILRPSRDPIADQITCRLASARFRFRPARNANGEPVESTYGWQQRWFYPVENN